MPEFSYIAVDEEGKTHKGKIRAGNAYELERNIQSLGLELISEKELKGKKIRSKKITRRERINFLINLKQLLNAGVPILDGLKDIRDSMPKSFFRDVITTCIESIEGGKTLSQSMEQFPTAFDSVFISLMRVGEETGQLGNVVDQIAESLKWADEMASQTKKVLIYPTVVSVVVFAVVAFLMIYLVPKLIPVLLDLGGEIPGYTKALIATSEFFVNYWQFIMPAPFAIVFILKILKKHNTKVAGLLDKLAINFPLIGPLNFKLKVARFCNYFALMYSSGLTVMDCMHLCEEIMDNVILNESVRKAREHINDGKNISQSFEETDLFPPLVIRMLRIGESTGGLDEALRNICYFYTRDAKESIDKIEPAIGPMLTVVMGGLLGWIMMAVMGPIYEIFNKI